jgi:hypothetical protein
MIFFFILLAFKICISTPSLIFTWIFHLSFFFLPLCCIQSCTIYAGNLLPAFSPSLWPLFWKESWLFSLRVYRICFLFYLEDELVRGDRWREIWTYDPTASFSMHSRPGHFPTLLSLVLPAFMFLSHYPFMLTSICWLAAVCVCDIVLMTLEWINIF